jgi:SNF2 family DNA or RNA helicase
MLEVIDISSEEDPKEQNPPESLHAQDDEVQITHVRNIVRPSDHTEEVQIIGQQDTFVCFGMFRAPVQIFQPIGTSFVFVKVNFDFRPNQSHRAITFSFDNNTERIAEMHDLYARFLFTLAATRVVQLEAFLDLSDPFSPISKILLYGLPRSGSQVAEHFLKHKTTLEHPEIQPKRRYDNPLYQQYQENLQNQSTSQTQIMDQTKRQIEELYKSFTSPENLLEMEQDERLSSPLFKYQKQALHWMYHRENVETSGDLLFWKQQGTNWVNLLTESKVSKRPKSVRGGILADDMGLGKTIQIISLILKGQPENFTEPVPLAGSSTAVDPFGFLPPTQVPKKIEEDPNIGRVPSRSTLIICPLSLIHNWEDQIFSHTKRDSLSVLVHHGPGRLSDPYEIAKHDVVITTYNVIGHRFGKNNECTPLHRIYWYRIVLDEAHIIKSSNTLQAKSVFTFKADVKWCLTGTPVQNKLDDLFSLVRFIEIPPLDRKADWCTFITRPIIQQKSQTAFRRLQTLMKGITLRRVKTDLIDGRPILELPKRSEHVMTLELNTTERQTYDRIHQAGKHVFETLREKGHVLTQFAMILKAVLMMRQACLHPQLAKWDEKEFLGGKIVSSRIYNAGCIRPTYSGSSQINGSVVETD